MRARKRGAEAAIWRLEDVLDSSEARAGKKRCVKPTLGGPSGMHALDHRAILRGHQAARLGAGNAERMHYPVGVERQRARCRGCRCEHADGRARMPALADMLRPHAQPDARPDFVSGERRRNEIFSRRRRLGFGQRDQRRQRHCADMQHALAMYVVEFEALDLRTLKRVPLTNAACADDSRAFVPQIEACGVLSTCSSVCRRMRHHSSSAP